MSNYDLYLNEISEELDLSQENPRETKSDDPKCEHTSILRALVEYPQGNLEEIQEKTLQSTQEEPGGRQDRKAQTYATERYTASRTASANTGEAICTLVPVTSPPRTPS
jgi:hypothetical protein